MCKWLFIEPGRIGDWIVATAAVHRFAKTHNVVVDWAVRDEIRTLLTRSIDFERARSIPDHVTPGNLLKLAAELLTDRTRYDGCCVLSHGRSGAFVAALAPANTKCGYLNLLAPYRRDDRSRNRDPSGRAIHYAPGHSHLLGRNLLALGLSEASWSYPDMIASGALHPRLHLTPHDHDLARQVLQPVLSSPSTPYALMSCTSRWRYKQWPIERWQSVAAQLAARNIDTVVAVAPPEHAGILRIAHGFPSDRCHIVDPVSLPVFAALAHGAHVVLTHDSAAMHIAAAVGSRLVAIYGPTDPKVSGPLTDRDNFRIVKARPRIDCRPCLSPAEDPTKGKPCINRTHACMRNISVDTVMEAIEDLLRSPWPR